MYKFTLLPEDYLACSLPAGRGQALYSTLESQDLGSDAVTSPLWREGLCGFDWLALRSSAVYFGLGVEHGRGEPVVVVPGFLASDLSLIELHAWLGRIGYRPYFSNIGRNADCPDALAEMLADTVRLASAETGERVRLIGHSLGGMLARSVALDHPELVECVISMGSPLGGASHAHPAVVAATESLRYGPNGQHLTASCFQESCSCAFSQNMREGTGDPYGAVRHYSIFSKLDGVVDWTSCREADDSLNNEVGCTHIGMAFHPRVYRALAERLASEGEAISR
jgi:pimeloyl-ACP methyl ester carboxylesterase